MYDFDKNKMAGQPVRRASLLDEIGQKLYENVFARDETHIVSIEFADLASYFIQMKSKYPETDQCLIYYEKNKDAYDICQVMLDKDGNELRLNNKMCVGRRLVVNILSDSLLKWFGGKTSKIMNKENIF